MISDPLNISALLRQCDNGDKAALDRLIDIVYPELRRRARHIISRRGRDPLLQSTVLVNEFCERLVRLRPAGWENRSHFFRYAAKAMRNISKDFARRQRARGGELLPLDSMLAGDQSSYDGIDVDSQLAVLERIDPRKAQIMEMHLYAQLTDNEIASCLGIDRTTVSRERKAARAFLRSRLGGRT